MQVVRRSGQVQFKRESRGREVPRYVGDTAVLSIKSARFSMATPYHDRSCGCVLATPTRPRADAGALHGKAAGSPEQIHETKVEPALHAPDGIMTGVAVGYTSAEELLEDSGGPRRDVLVREELCANLNCGRG